MKRLMVVREKLYSFDKKGMVFPVRPIKGGYYVRALDIVLYNHYFMSKSEIERCLSNGTEFEWCYKDKDLTILNNKKLIYLNLENYNLIVFIEKKDS